MSSAISCAGRNGTELEVAERLSIAIDVAHAITYLHSYTGKRLMFGDIKEYFI